MFVRIVMCDEYQMRQFQERSWNFSEMEKLRAETGEQSDDSGIA